MKKFTAIVLTLIMILSVCPMVFAADGDSPVIIWTAKDLEKIRERLDGNYILAQDIDLSGVEGFMPIGSEEEPFTGTFDGNGHTISGVNIRVTYECQNGDKPRSISFFEAVSGGTIRNVNMSSAYYLSQVFGFSGENPPLSYAQAGGIVGLLTDGGLIENCSVSGTVASIGYNFTFVRSGGIAVSCVDSVIRNCSCTAAVFAATDYANAMAGGIAAWSSNSEISNCFVGGRMYCANTNSYAYAGGVVASGDFRAANCVVAMSDITIEGTTTYSGTVLTDAVSAFCTQSGCVVSDSAAQILGNKGGALSLREELFRVKSVYTDKSWDFDNIWEMTDTAPKLIHKNTTQYITETEDGTTIKYNNTSLFFSDGILSVDGTDGILSPASAVTSPMEFFAADTQVLIIGEQVPFIDENVFEGFENVEIIVLRGNTTVRSHAFPDCEKISLIYLGGSPAFENIAFPENIKAEVFTLESNLYSGVISQGIKNHNVRREGGKLHISGELDIDAYLFFDLCSLLCGSYSDVNQIDIDKFICNNIQFFKTNKDSGFPEPIWDHTLTNAEIRVKVPTENDEWTETTWNYLCELGITDNLDNFRLTIVSDEYEEIEDTEIEIKDEEDIGFFGRLLKFITSLIDRFFKIFSRFS